MSLEIDRAKPIVHVRTRPILMSGAKAFRLSARFAPTAIGYFGSALNDDGNRRLDWESRTGHDSPGGTNVGVPVLAVRLRETDAPRLPPYRSVNLVSPWRSYASEYPARNTP